VKLVAVRKVPIGVNGNYRNRNNPSNGNNKHARWEVIFVTVNNKRSYRRLLNSRLATLLEYKQIITMMTIDGKTNRDGRKETLDTIDVLAFFSPMLTPHIE
jgi:hypothetical protein